MVAAPIEAIPMALGMAHSIAWCTSCKFTRFVLQLPAKRIILSGVMKKPFFSRILSIALTLCTLLGAAGLSSRAYALPQTSPAATASPDRKSTRLNSSH